MYHALLRRRTRGVFERISRSDPAILTNTSENVHHVFPGDHPLGGERHSKAAVAAWFERLYRLFPGHDFTVKRVVSRGWPWSTWVAVQWVARLTPRAGDPYENDGAHWLHVRWGKVDRIHAYLDTQLVEQACRTMAAAGIDEASAAPITD
jgi:ketosteroid isomerase-like protein